MYANRVFPASQYSAGIFKPRASIILKSFRSFSDITEVKQNLRSIVTDFNFGAVKLPLNLPNIALFLILSLRHESRFAKALVWLVLKHGTPERRNAGILKPGTQNY